MKKFLSLTAMLFAARMVQAQGMIYYSHTQ
jgi:hypothetical protein